MSEPKPAPGPQVYGYYCSACLADGKLRAVYETPGGAACKKGHGGVEAPLDAAAVLVGGAEWHLGRVPAVRRRATTTSTTPVCRWASR